MFASSWIPYMCSKEKEIRLNPVFNTFFFNLGKSWELIFGRQPVLRLRSGTEFDIDEIQNEFSNYWENAVIKVCISNRSTAHFIRSVHLCNYYAYMTVECRLWQMYLFWGWLRKEIWIRIRQHYMEAKTVMMRSYFIYVRIF